jgi:hypothetical protein
MRPMSMASTLMRLPVTGMPIRATSSRGRHRGLGYQDHRARNRLLLGCPIWWQGTAERVQFGGSLRGPVGHQQQGACSFETRPNVLPADQGFLQRGTVIVQSAARPSEARSRPEILAGYWFAGLEPLDGIG